MRRLLPAALAAAVLVLAGCDADDVAPPGRSSIDVDLSALRGPLVVNLRASNCGPCRLEMPAIQEFHERHGDRVGVLGIDHQDAQPAAALALARRSGVTYPMVADPGGDINAKSPVPVIRGIPVLAFVTADGDVSAVPGGIESADELVELAQQHGIDP